MVETLLDGAQLMKNLVKILNDKEMEKTWPEDYGLVLETIVTKIKAAQARAIRAVNFELVTAYRDIDQIIHEKQSRVEWGAFVVERLAADLRNLFPKTKGFSSRNLWIMRDLYVSYRDHEKLQILSAESRVEACGVFARERGLSLPAPK